MNWAILFPHSVAIRPNVRLMMDEQCLETPKRVFSTAFFCAKVQNTVFFQEWRFHSILLPFILEPQTGTVLDGKALPVYNGVQFSGEKLASSRFFFERARVWRFNARFRIPYFARNYLLNGSKEKFRRNSIRLNGNKEGPTTTRQTN